MKTCRDCVLKDLQSQICRPLQRRVNLDKDTCPLHTSTISVCDMCGQQFLGKPIISVDSDDTILSICPNCDQHYSKCQTCRGAAQCSFETDPIAIPKVIMRTTQQGNTVIQHQVINPARVEATCKQGCACWNDEENLCNRQSLGFCPNYSRMGGEEISPP